MKPIVVLLLALAAIAALVFGLFALGKDDARAPLAPEQPSAPLATPAAPAGKLEHVAGLERPVEPPAETTTRTEPPSRAIVEKDRFVYPNELRVLVVDAQAKPLADVEVTLTDVAAREVTFLDDTRAPYVLGPQRTDKTGRTSFFSVVPSATYTLVCVHRDYARAERETGAIDQEGVFEVPPIALSTGATLQGFVKDDQGHGVPDATLLLEGPRLSMRQSSTPDRQEGKTNAEGWYEIKNVPPGDGRPLTATAKGYGRMLRNNLHFEKDSTTYCDLVLRAAETLCGRVVGPANTPIAGARVLVVGVNGAAQTGREETRSDAQGEFCFDALAPGEYNVVANLRGWRFRAQTRVKTNSPKVVIEAQREASVCGQVVEAATGAPVAEFNCRVRSFTDADTPTSAVGPPQAFRDAQGNFCSAGVQEGQYVIEAWAEGFAHSYSPSFEVSMGKDVQGVVVRLSRGGSISGRIVDADGKPLAKARVLTRPNDWADDGLADSSSVFPTHATQAETRSSSDGTFRLANLTPAQYQLVIEAVGAARTTRKDISVLDSGDASQGDIQLARGGSIAGTISDASGKGIPGASVVLIPSDGQALPLPYTTQTGPDGHYVVKNVTAGRYLLRAGRGKLPSAGPPQPLPPWKDSERQVTVAEEQETRLDLTLQN